MTIQILADSACDLPQSYAELYNFKIVPLTVHLAGADYLDGQTIQPETVYDAMRNGKTTKTSQVSPHIFKDIFTECAKTNTPLLYIAFSSGLSGTYQTAKMMETEIKESYPNAPIHIIDTKCASLGYGLIVLEACKQLKTGLSIQEIIKSVKQHTLQMEHVFTVDDLEYLYRGGRVSKTAAFIGTLLKIKPLLDVQDGKLIPIEKIRGEKRVLSRMIEVMEERGTNLSNQMIAISHGDDIKRAEQLADLIVEKFGINREQIIIEMVGAVIGAHSGPGTLALFFKS